MYEEMIYQHGEIGDVCDILWIGVDVSGEDETTDLAIELRGVEYIRAVIADITDAVTVGVSLVRIKYRRAVIIGATVGRVAGITETVTVTVNAYYAGSGYQRLGH